MAEHDAKLQTYVAQLKELVTELDDLVEQSQAILAAQLSPEGISEHEAINQLLGMLDGPDWRQVEERRKRVCKECRKGTSFHARLDKVQDEAERELQLHAGTRRTLSRPAASKRQRRTSGTGPLKEGTF
jgi:hypothetical protein